MLDGISRHTRLIRAVWILFATAGAWRRRVSSAHRFHAPGAAIDRANSPSSGSSPSRRARPVLGRRRQAARAGSRRHATRVIEIKRSGFSRGYTRDGPRRPRVERQVPTGSADRGRRLAHPLGRRLPPAADLLRRAVERRAGDVAQSAAAGALPREEARPARPRREGPLVVLPEPVRRHAAATRACSSSRRCSATPISRTRRTRSTTLDEPFEGAKKWYVARDLGQTFGRTGVLDAPRGDIEVFEQTPFIKGVVEGARRVRLPRPPQACCSRTSGPSDVRWICTRLDALTDDPVAGRVSRRRLPEADRRPLHRAHETEDSRGARAEGLMLNTTHTRRRTRAARHRRCSPCQPMLALARPGRARDAERTRKAQADSARDASPDEDETARSAARDQDRDVPPAAGGGPRRRARAPAQAPRHAAAPAGRRPDADHPRGRRRRHHARRRRQPRARLRHRRRREPDSLPVEDRRSEGRRRHARDARGRPGGRRRAVRCWRRFRPSSSSPRCG